jgi:hypothetical protein
VERQGALRGGRGRIAPPTSHMEGRWAADEEVKATSSKRRRLRPRCGGSASRESEEEDAMLDGDRRKEEEEATLKKGRSREWVTHGCELFLCGLSATMRMCVAFEHSDDSGGGGGSAM